MYACYKSNFKFSTLIVLALILKNDANISNISATEQFCGIGNYFPLGMVDDFMVFLGYILHHQDIQDKQAGI